MSMTTVAMPDLAVVLFRPKFSENVGSVARACLNMGCGRIILVDPQGWDLGRAVPLATPKAVPLLEGLEVVGTLGEALAGFTHVFGTTARTGGWRRGIVTPERMGPAVAGQMREGGRVAVVFGPEDRGLTNEEIELCGQLVRIPTASEGTSLNLAQAVLVILYECFKAVMERPAVADGGKLAGVIGHEEREVLYGNMREALLAVHYLKAENTEYWMLPVRRFMQRLELKRAEFNVLMGICRQVKWVAGKAGLGAGGE